ncbi:MAG: sulfurtransferase [Chlorobia bacterium]|nr:sulfurtransferase [Fimbriimonadaceae bacterium]
MVSADITPQELQAELASSTPPVLLDVREPHELEISVLPNVVHIPMREIPGRLSELDSGADIVIVCRSGIRSGRVMAYLDGLGFSRVRNLLTGMNGWAATIDPTMPTY